MFFVQLYMTFKHLKYYIFLKEPIVNIKRKIQFKKEVKIVIDL